NTRWRYCHNATGTRTATHAIASAVANHSGRIAKAASHSAGRVTISPMAVTTGAATLSRSQPRRTATRAVHTVTTSTSTLEATPPSTEMTRKSIRLMCGIPISVVTSHARTASATDTYTVSRHEPATD